MYSNTEKPHAAKSLKYEFRVPSLTLNIFFKFGISKCLSLVGCADKNFFRTKKKKMCTLPCEEREGVVDARWFIFFLTACAHPHKIRKAPSSLLLLFLFPLLLDPFFLSFFLPFFPRTITLSIKKISVRRVCPLFDQRK